MLGIAGCITAIYSLMSLKALWKLQVRLPEAAVGISWLWYKTVFSNGISSLQLSCIDKAYSGNIRNASGMLGVGSPCLTPKLKPLEVATALWQALKSRVVCCQGGANTRI